MPATTSIATEGIIDPLQHTGVTQLLEHESRSLAIHESELICQLLNWPEVYAMGQYLLRIDSWGVKIGALSTASSEHNHPESRISPYGVNDEVLNL